MIKIKQAEYRLTLDVNSDVSQASLSVRREDSARALRISFREDGRPFPLSDGVYAVFSARKPDGTVVYADCETDGSTVVYQFTEGLTSVGGRADCEIILFGANSKRITSPRFTLYIREGVTQDGDIESTDEFSALTKLMSEVGDALDNLATEESVNLLYVTAADAVGVAETAAANAAESALRAAESAKEAASAAGGGVITFNGREGAVLPQYGDYTADMVGADPIGSASSESAAAVGEHDSSPAAHAGMFARPSEMYTAAIDTDWTVDTSNGGYKKTVGIPGISADDDPVADVLLGEDTEANKLYLAAWSCVTRITTFDGGAVLWANGERPSNGFTLMLKAVR